MHYSITDKVCWMRQQGSNVGDNQESFPIWDIILFTLLTCTFPCINHLTVTPDFEVYNLGAMFIAINLTVSNIHMTYLLLEE
jgi:hypothetical protein